MSKQPEALRLADVLDAGVNFYAESSLWFDNDLCRATDLAAAELRRLHSVNADLLEALRFYADPTRYHGPNQPMREPDQWSSQVGLSAYRLDVTRDGGVIARAAIAKAEEA